MGEIVYAIPHLEEALLDLLDAIGKGFALAEIIWGVDGRRARVTELKWIPQKKVTFRQSLEPRLLTRKQPWQGVTPPPWKVIYHRYKARSGYASRAGVLRVVGWMYLLKNFALKDWAAFNEVFGMPLRLGKYDAGLDPGGPGGPGPGRAQSGVRRRRGDQQGHGDRIRGGHLPGSGRPTLTSAWRNFATGRCPRRILGQTLTTDTPGATGTYAAAKVHGQVRQDLVEADAQALATTLREQLLRPAGGLQFRLGQAGALVPFQVRGGGRPQDPVGGLPQPGGPGGAPQPRAPGGTFRDSFIVSSFEFRFEKRQELAEPANE